MALKKMTAAKKAPTKGASAPAKPTKAAPSVPARPVKAAPATTVTLKHLAAELAASHQKSNKQAETDLMEIVDILVSHLKAGDRLRINCLGILEVKDRPARSGRNPATGAVIQIAASKKIAFRPAKELKEAI